ncbi:hypothetical protein BJX70DRAFT_311402 [Aspergillus crustosus]
MLVRTRSIHDTASQDVNFDSNHPRHLSHVQRLALSPRQTATVTLQGQLTEFQTAEDSLRGAHPVTNAILNDLAEILPGLFVPWERIPDLVQQPLLTANERIAYHPVWSAVEQFFLYIFGLLRRIVDVLWVFRYCAGQCPETNVVRRRDKVNELVRGAYAKGPEGASVPGIPDFSGTSPQFEL